MRRRSPARWLFAPFLAALFPAIAAADGPPSIDWDYIESWIAFQKRIGSLEANFVQTRTLPTLRLPQERPGRIWYRAPDSFRMELGEPAEVVLVGNRQRLVLTDHKRGTTEIFEEDAATGRGFEKLAVLRLPIADDLEEFRRLFEVRQLEFGAPVTTLILGLRDPAANAVSELRLEIDPATRLVTHFEIRLRNGGSLRTRFTNIRTGVPIDPDRFREETGTQFPAR